MLQPNACIVVQTLQTSEAVINKWSPTTLCCKPVKFRIRCMVSD